MGDNQSSNPSKRSVLILYGSETGNAQEVAEELGVLTERLHFATHVCELNQSKPVRSVFTLYYHCDVSVTNSVGITGGSFLLHADHLRHLHYRPGRLTGELEDILEVPSAEEATADIFGWSQFCIVWVGR